MTNRGLNSKVDDLDLALADAYSECAIALQSSLNGVSLVLKISKGNFNVDEAVISEVVEMASASDGIQALVWQPLVDEGSNEQAAHAANLIVKHSASLREGFPSLSELQTAMGQLDDSCFAHDVTYAATEQVPRTLP